MKPRISKTFAQYASTEFYNSVLNFITLRTKNDELQLEFFLLKVARHYDMHFNQGSFYFWKLMKVMPMFTRSMSHKEVNFVSYVDSKFANLKEIFVKELKEDLLSSITSLINEQNRQIENLNGKLTKQNSAISVLQNNVEVLNKQCWKDINTKCDELKQYSKRQCLRIEGIVKTRKEKVEDVKSC